MRLLCPRCSRTFTHSGEGAATCPECGYAAAVSGGARAGAPAPAEPVVSGYQGALPPPAPELRPATGAGTTNGLAIASLVLGVLGIIGGFFLILPPLLAFVFGIVAVNQIPKRNQKGKGLAIAGIVLGSIPMAGYLFFVIMFFFIEVVGFNV